MVSFAAFSPTFYVKLDSSGLLYSNSYEQDTSKRKGKIIEVSTHKKNNCLIVYNNVRLQF
ncbi:MAG: hypothetical protein ACJAVE_001348 [Polaribacter sp.]|jgi:hypothetical protein